MLSFEVAFASWIGRWRLGSRARFGDWIDNFVFVAEDEGYR